MFVLNQSDLKQSCSQGAFPQFGSDVCNWACFLKYHFKKMMSLCKPPQAPSVWFQFSMWGLRVSCSLSVTFHAIKRRLPKWGSGTPEEPYSEDKPSLLARLCQHGPPSHSLSRSLLFWITCITTDITFSLFLYWFPVSNLGHAHHHHPLQSLLIRWTLSSRQKKKKSSQWLTSRAEVRSRKRVGL